MNVRLHRCGWDVRWRDADGRQRGRRIQSEDAARAFAEAHAEVSPTKETFAGSWARWLAQRRPYLEGGTWTGYEIDTRKRLLPAFGARSLGDVSIEDVRDFVAEFGRAVEARELRSNNALGVLGVCLDSAFRDGLPAVNPALHGQRLPPAHIERDYLPLDEMGTPRFAVAASLGAGSRERAWWGGRRPARASNAALARLPAREC